MGDNIKNVFNAPSPRELNVFVESGRDCDKEYIEKFLKNFGPNAINLKNKHGWTVLAFAAAFDRHEMAYFSLDKGAMIDVRDKNGRTPLMLAAMSGHTNMVIFLMRRGAGADLTDKDGLTARELAVQYSHVETARYIGDIIKRREAAARLASSKPN